MGVVNVVCVLITEGDIIHLPSKLLGRSIVRRVRIHERSFPCFSEIALLGPLRLPGEMQSTEDSPDLTRWSRLALVVG